MVASAGIAALGSIAGSAIGGIASNASAFKQYKYQRKLNEQMADLNYRYGKKATVNQYGWQRKGLETAGYNPMLAIQGASGPANSSFASNGSAQQADMSSMGHLVSNATDILQARKNVEQADSNIELNKANSDKLNAEATAQTIKNGYLDKREQKEIENIEGQSSLLRSQSNYYDNVLENQEKIAEIQANANVTSARIGANGMIKATGMNNATAVQNNIRDNETARTTTGANLVNGLTLGALGYFGAKFGNKNRVRRAGPRRR